VTEKPRQNRAPVDEEAASQRRIEEADAELRADPRFEEEEETLEEGETEIIFGEWIPGSRRPKESDQ
jgi:hypothetical protein